MAAKVKGQRIIEASPGLKTLILTGPRKATWGFFRTRGHGSMQTTFGEFVDWSVYERELGTL